ncbi:MAG: right-handed parallel beta-helix repeat-containing protein [candidate division Zixibacteria bacterium]|nr:right-handed parallel beta-helix repeat-containing protein [candidate division Zixibacteria bacterium]
MKRLITISLIMLLAAAVYADYHYANQNGLNLYPYTSWENGAWRIQNAVDASSPHDTVYIGVGEWNETIVLDCDSLAIIGMGWDSTLVWSDVEDVPTFEGTANRAHSYYIEGLFIRNLAGWAIRAAGGNNLHVNQCRFTGTSGRYGGRGISAAYAPNKVSVENCTFDTLSTCIQDILGTNSETIQNCVFTNFSFTGLNSRTVCSRIRNNIFAHTGLYNNVADGHTDTLFFCNNLIYDSYAAISLGSDYNIFMNNTIDLRGNNPEVAVLNPGDSCIMTNNSLSNIRKFTHVDGGEYLRLAYNNFWNVEEEVNVHQGATLDTTGGNLRLNPMYFGDRDYHLQAFSPLIDAGDPDIFDLDSTRSDIGFLGGPGGEVYDYLDLPPLIPDSITFEVNIDSVIFTWRMNTESDFNRYLVFRDTISGFEPSPANLIGEKETSFFIDTSFAHGRAN